MGKARGLVAAAREYLKKSRMPRLRTDDFDDIEKVAQE
jgi:hypothetical protein